MDNTKFRQTAIQQAREQLTEAFSESFTDRFVEALNKESLAKNGFYMIDNDDGVVRYVYLEDGPGEENVLKDINDNGLIILDENEDDFWYEAIDPEDLMNNNILQEIESDLEKIKI